MTGFIGLKAQRMGGSNGKHVFKLPCNVCAESEWVEVDGYLMAQYLRGALVQNVFPAPEFSAEYREQIIGIRSGYHVCENCWGVVFAEEE